MLLLAQVTGLMAGSLNIGRFYIKDEKLLLMFLMGLHLFIGITFVVLTAFPGAFVCFLLGILYMINYIFKYREKNVPLVVLIVYGVVCAILGLFTSTNYVINILPASIGVLTVANIYFADKKNISRIIEIILGVVWTIYGLLTGAFMVSLSYIVIVVLFLRVIFIVGMNSDNDIELASEVEIDLAKEEAEREKIKEANFIQSKKKLESGGNTEEVLLTSRLLNSYKNPNSSSSRGIKIFGKRGHHKKNNTYQSRYKRL